MAGRVGILSPGDMGHAVGASLGERGFEVLTDLSGRGPETRRRAERAGFRDAGSLEALTAEVDLLLSILPPDQALALARTAAESMAGRSKPPLYVDCNAISPQTARSIEAVLGEAGVDLVDGGLIGRPPTVGGPATRLYVSGPRVDELRSLHGEHEGRGIDVRPVGDEVGRASAVKMAYAGLTKGTMTLHAAVLIAAERMGLSRELQRELQESQAHVWGRMGVIPFLPADSKRWLGEMQEIAATFRSVGLPGGFHEAAEEIFRLMAATPFASETRETLDTSRTLEETLRVLAAAVADV